MIIEYDVNCFERTLTIHCPDSYAIHEEKILELLDKYYEQWHNPEEAENDDDRDWLEADACCEEYMMAKIVETYPECLEWNSIYYGNDEDEIEEENRQNIIAHDWNLHCTRRIIDYLEGMNAKLKVDETTGRQISNLITNCINKLEDIEENE